MKRHTFSLPNILTYGRIGAVFLVVVCFFLEKVNSLCYIAHWTCAAIFVIACVTDFLDGYFARIWQQTSNIGRLLDPIADKLLVSSCLLLLTATHTINGISVIAAVIILCREILVSGLREYLAEMKIHVPVSNLAKWKTATQMFAMILLLCGPAGDALIGGVTIFGLFLLWVAALLTLITGWEYMSNGLNHL